MARAQLKYQAQTEATHELDPMLQLGQTLRERREMAGMSRAALALRAGVSETTVKNLENGRTNATRTTLLQLCAINELKLNLAELLPLTGEAEGPPLNCWLAPGFDPIGMAQDLTTRLS